jgi:hypothetical protein
MTTHHLEPDLIADIARRCAAYMEAAPTRRVTPDEAALARLADLNVPFPDSPLAVRDVFERIDRLGSPATTTTTGGRYYGFVNGGALPATTAASWLVAAWNQNVALRVMSPAGAAFEEAALNVGGGGVGPSVRAAAPPRSPARRSRTSPACRRHAMRCWPAAAGMSSATACSARRLWPSSSATRCTCRC